MRRLQIFFLFWIFTGATLPLCAEAAGAPQPPNPGQNLQGLQQHADALQAQAEKTSEKLAATDRDVTHLEQSIVILIGFSALAVTVFIATVIFSEFRLTRSAKDLESRAEEVKKRYPMLDGMEKLASSALKEIEVIFAEDEWMEDRYGDLEIRRRQHIFTVEHLIASGFAGPTTAPQLRGMANFYFSKYNAEHLEYDLDRALYYALLAEEKGNFAFQYKNDLGFIYMDLGKRDPKYTALAVKAFQDSRRSRPSQQRCYYNLAVIGYDAAMQDLKTHQMQEAREKLEASAQELRIALTHENWEFRHNKKLISAIHYNLACFLSRLASLSGVEHGNAPLYDESLHHLEMAANEKQTKPSTVEFDLQDQEGDLHALRANPAYEARVLAISAKFMRMWQI
jgi:hypothetical protein